MAVDHYENFPVASVLCPPALRPPITAIYGFARTADDIADEGAAPPHERIALLDAYRTDLETVLKGNDPGPKWPHVFLALRTAINDHALPAQPLRDLLDAFRQDSHNPTYSTRNDLLEYCRMSANPVGRLLLHLYGIDDEASRQRSDAICSALQLINFWQDLSVDIPRGRCYLPTQDLHEHKLSIDDLANPRDPVTASALRGLVADLCRWSRSMMNIGAPLAGTVPGRAGWELKLVVQGGLRILDKIAAMDHQTLMARPKVTLWDAPLLLWRAVAYRS